MNLKFEEFLDQAIDKFSSSCAKYIGKRVEVEKGKIIKLGPDILEKTLKTMFSGRGKKIAKEMVNHLGDLEGKLVFISSPKGFRTAWYLRKTKKEYLTRAEASKLINDGCKFIPMMKEYNLLLHGQKGMITSKFHPSLLEGVRHSEGTYEDTLDEEGNFSYERPMTLTGMLRYRWLEFLTVKCQVPLFLYVTIWYKYNAFENHQYNTVISPAIITSVNNRIDAPLRLKIIPAEKGYQIIDELRAFEEIDTDIKFRPSLNEMAVTNYNFEKLSKSNSGKTIKEWAISKGKRCPGSLCKNVRFKELKSQEIAFGHIISQDWANSFPFLLGNVHHPDNLYLTCRSCNSSLGNQFPDKNLRDAIVSSKHGTIGDWLRQGNF